ncbi:MAG: hypothetical protein BWY69_01498 [Planctomycetes bacterium ADurb.Bin401]|nr:MAG: hypothetical protein BWY69_01498 [Planctomycetes bacterium ADurb.Bin401]
MKKIRFGACEPWVAGIWVILVIEKLRVLQFINIGFFCNAGDIVHEMFIYDFDDGVCGEVERFVFGDVCCGGFVHSGHREEHHGYRGEHDGQDDGHDEG